MDIQTGPNQGNNIQIFVQHSTVGIFAVNVINKIIDVVFKTSMVKNSRKELSLCHKP